MAAVHQCEALLRGGAEVLEGVGRDAGEGLQGLLRREAVLHDAARRSASSCERKSKDSNLQDQVRAQ